MLCLGADVGSMHDPIAQATTTGFSGSGATAYPAQAHHKVGSNLTSTFKPQWRESKDFKPPLPCRVINFDIYDNFAPKEMIYYME